MSNSQKLFLRKRRWILNVTLKIKQHAYCKNKSGDRNLVSTIDWEKTCE